MLKNNGTFSIHIAFNSAMRIRIHIKFVVYSLLASTFLIFLVAIFTSPSIRQMKVLQAKNIKDPLEHRNFSISEMMGSSNVFNVVRPNQSTILMEPSSVETRPFAVIAVTSMAKYFKHRQTIRETWGKWADMYNSRIFFIIGFHDMTNVQLFKTLEEEQRIYNDLIVDLFQEGYYRLPGKMLRLLKWYNATYTEETAPRFLVKTDHDVFLHLPNIITALKGTPYYRNLASLSTPSSTSLSDGVTLPYDPSDPETYFLGGRKFVNATIDPDPDSKWYIDELERERLNWHDEVFPPYLNGPCYILSGNVVKAIYETSFDQPIFPFEDVYLTGMIAYSRLDLQLSNMSNMMHNEDLCSLSNKGKLKKMLSWHPVEYPTLMVRICKKIASCNKVMSSVENVAVKNVPVTLFIMTILLNLIQANLLT